MLVSISFFKNKKTWIDDDGDLKKLFAIPEES